MGALVTANQNIIDLIARRYSSPATTMNDVIANSNAIAGNARKNSATDVSIKMPEKSNESPHTTTEEQKPQTPQTPTSPSSMLNKLSPGNIFKNIFK